MGRRQYSELKRSLFENNKIFFVIRYTSLNYSYIYHCYFECIFQFVLEDGEYLTALVGYYDKIYGVDEPAIISLQFKTNKRESSQFGINGFR